MLGRCVPQKKAKPLPRPSHQVAHGTPHLCRTPSKRLLLNTHTMQGFIKRGCVQVDPDWLPKARKSLVLVKKL